MMFERFTTGARQVVQSADHEARRLQHGHIGTEHLLLALLRADGAGGAVLLRAGLHPDRVDAEIRRHVGAPDDPFDQAAEAALESIGIDLRQIRARLEEAFGPDALSPLARRRCRSGGPRPFTPRAKKVLELGLQEARQLGSAHIGPEHLVLGILREGRGLASRIIADAGLNPAALRRDILDEMGRAA
jgi:ATP-dependent Clp protease ATP-binding subunit ClpA